MQQVIDQLSQLAQESEMSVDINWDEMKISKNDIFNHMANNVLQQMESVDENERAVVAMATMTKLLVENFIYNSKINGNKS
tara:strand:+ start:159 stop:401 length:243 start_codon:yes stop_codon:yes gene_type:complete